MTRFWHGGVSGLRRGDLIVPGHSRAVDGCPICVERAAGRSVIDPANAQDGRVYITTDREYARFYASLAVRGDLYIVEPVGELRVSDEDHFETYTAESARVVTVYDRAVLMNKTQRAALLKRWTAADFRAEGRAGELEAMSVADRRALYRKQQQMMIRGARQLVHR